MGKRFGWNWALKEVSLDIPPGAVVALSGPNGSGKTTLLKIVGALQRPSTGEGDVLGDALASESAIRAKTGFLSVRGYLYDDLTATENLDFALRMSGTDAERGRVESILERVGLDAVAEGRVRTFSTGMRKRLALAQLLIRSIRVALLDEPYSGLDSEGIGLVDEIVRDFRSDGVTVLLASHRGGEAVDQADLHAELRQGRLEVRNQ